MRSNTENFLVVTVSENTNHETNDYEVGMKFNDQTTQLSLMRSCQHVLRFVEHILQTIWFNEHGEQDLQIKWNVAHDCPYCVNLRLKLDVRKMDYIVFRMNCRMPEGRVCSLLSSIR